MSLLLGIDVGTTHVKVGTYQPDGAPVSVARRRTPTTVLKSDWAEHPSDQLWRTVAGAIREVLAAPAPKVQAIGIGGMAEAGLLVDRHGIPLTELVAWFDRRAERYVAQWIEEMGDDVFRSTGLVPSHKVPLVKLQWFRDEHPDLLKEAWKWLHAPDFIALRLSGEAATAPSLAGRTMAFDIHKQEWCDWILDAAGIPSRLWPSVRSSTDRIGVVTREAAAETGLHPGTPVVIAGHDHLCGAAAVGVLEPGRTLNSLGTAETVITVLDELPADRERGRGYDFGNHLADGKYYMLAGLSRSGGTIDWWLDRLVGNKQRGAGEEHPENDRSSSYEQVLSELASLPSRPTGVLHLPYLKGSGPPDKQPSATGVLLGLTEDLDVGQWMKAVLEGLACEFRRMLEGMPVSTHPITVIGGGVRNRPWLQLKADVARRELAVPDIDEAVVQGAAIAAGVSVGAYGTMAEGASALAGSTQTLRPESTSAQAYDQWYRHVFLAARTSLLEIDEMARSLGA